MAFQAVGGQGCCNVAGIGGGIIIIFVAGETLGGNVGIIPHIVTPATIRNRMSLG
jgi:hypothetical protein